ncbi:MAG: hypothetical protein SFY69_05105 [Planctomycetota bacterium]|nr:hypothetical protein [Planctomycetota bacterium]
MDRMMMAVGALALASGVSSGAVTGVGGAATVIAPPASTVLGANQSNTQAWVFTEGTVVLASALTLNATTPGMYTSAGSLTPGSVAAGTTVQSHYLYTDPDGSAARTYEGFVEFDQPILGVIVLRSNLNASDAALGAPGTAYADNAARGLELGSNADAFAITVSQFRVNFRFVTSTATDDIRIITAPAPAGAALAGLCGLVALRRRR